MPETRTITVYAYDELEDRAKTTARDDCREIAIGEHWHDPVYQDFQNICKTLGVILEEHDKPAIRFSGFSRQGDGASFRGEWRYDEDAHKKIRTQAPKDTELHDIADCLDRAQTIHNAQSLRDKPRLHAYINFAAQSSYVHPNTMDIQVEDETGADCDRSQDDVIEALKRLADWLYDALRKEYEYLDTDEAVDEFIAGQDWLFTRDGQRFHDHDRSPQ